MKLAELNNSEIDVDPAYASTTITGISADSRKIAPGNIFAAFPGSSVDGARFIDSAVSSGATALLVGSDTDIGNFEGPVLRANDPRRALALLASRFFPLQPDIMAAVTGTAGKTSVASFLRQVWQSVGRNSAMIGTTGVEKSDGRSYGNLTTPDPVLLHQLLSELASDGVTHCSMEASSHGLDQRRLDGVALSVGAFTNLGRDHMDYHPTVEDYLAAKLRLFDTLLQPGQPAVFFADDAYSDFAIECGRARKLDVRTVGRLGSFLSLKRLEQQRFSQIAEIEHEGSIRRVELPMAGEFQLANALVAAAMALSTGAPVDETFAALQGLTGALGRLELVGQSASGAPAYVDYAHKPDALEHVLRALRPYTTGQLTVVFGCGGDRDQGKRPIMGEIAARFADRVIVTDDNPRSEDPSEIRAAILKTAGNAMEIADRRAAIQEAVGMLVEGDCLVVAGKGHEEGQIIGAEILPFSDHSVLIEALENKR